jgi:hypothetical protein
MFRPCLPYLACLALGLGLGACSTTSDIRACESHDECPSGQACIKNQCITNVNESCGPSGIACLAHEVCSPAGECVCSTDLANTPDACGCAPTIACADVADSPIKVMACVTNDETQALECICDEVAHSFDDGACGCKLVNCEKNGDVCENGLCDCVVANHMYDSAQCACGPACGDGEICSAGECICAEGTTRCGDRCIPYGYTCCNDGGEFCPVGTTCRTLPDASTLCQPQGTTPCFQGDEYIANCAPEETCIVDEMMEPHCLAPGVPPCIKDGQYVGECAPDETCIVDAASVPHCLGPGVSPCLFAGDLVGTCDPKETCIVDTQGGPHCVPPGGTPCYAGPDYKGYCTAGQKCSSTGTCIGVEESMCGDGLTVCPQGQTCVPTGPDQYTCHPGGTTACYTQNNYYGWNCNPGWNCGIDPGECNLPGWKECDDGTLCSSGEKCYRVAPDEWACAPNEAVICYHKVNGLNVADTWCPAYTQCPIWGEECVAPGWVECKDSALTCPQGATCIPKGPGEYDCLYPGTVACMNGPYLDYVCSFGEQCKNGGCE